MPINIKFRPKFRRVEQGSFIPYSLLMLTIESGTSFIRRVLHRERGDEFDRMYLSAFPENHWFWCHPENDPSSSVRASTTLTAFRYTARTTFHVTTSTNLAYYLPSSKKQVACAFDHLNNKVVEKDVLTAITSMCRDLCVEVIGLKRNTGSGDEYVFFSKSACGVLDAEELQV